MFRRRIVGCDAVQFRTRHQIFGRICRLHLQALRLHVITNRCYPPIKQQTVVTLKTTIRMKIVPDLSELNPFNFICLINISFELFQVFLKHPGKQRQLTTRVSNRSVITHSLPPITANFMTKANDVMLNGSNKRNTR